MEIRYPIILIIIPIILIITIIIIKRKSITFTKGTKVANTSIIKNNEYYQKKLKQYRLLSNLLKGLCLTSIIISTLLLARPSKVETINEDEYKRDIFLCMDVSGSVDKLNIEITENLKDIVKSLKGERFGISIFNSSSVLIVPLTTDYEYVLDTLEKLEKSIKYMDDYSSVDKGENTLELIYYITSGTIEGEGGSLIGDGLASCIYDFPNLDEDKDRTRIIILSTDNDLAGQPLLTLDEAANIAKKKNIIIYGIATSDTTAKNGTAFKAATNKTGGEYFKQGEMSTKDIVKNIEKQSKSLIKDNIKTYQIDVPTIPFIILLISIIILIYLDSKVIS